MRKAFEKKYHAMEETNWWFLARRELILALLKNQKRNANILDVGCSSGILIQELNTSGFTQVKGIDISQSAVDLSKARGIKNVFKSDAQSTGYKDKEFDIIIASDILEHLNNEEKALNEWNRILKPEGLILVFTPAFSFLWSSHDLANQHKKRYTRAGLESILASSGFKILRSSYWNFTLFLPAFITRTFQRVLMLSDDQQDQVYNLNKPTNYLLKFLLTIENKLIISG